MCRYAIALTLCLGMLLGCSQDKGVTAKAPPAQEPVTVGDFQLLPPIDAGSVSIIPVSLTKTPPQQDGNFITLGEAKKEGSVEITELGEGDVNALRVENKGTRPLLLLGGDLLLGGKQDRIVARDVIVPPGKTMNVEVFCVEHGRWDGQSEHFEYKSAVVPNKVRQAAAHEGQQEVWAEVDSYNTISGIGGASKTVNAGLDSEKVKVVLDRDLPKLIDSLKDNKNIVGFIYVLNGKLKSADLFGSPRVLDAAKESLLKGYLSDGASKPADPNSKVDMDACRKFIQSVIEGRQARARNQVANETLKFSARESRGVEVSAGSAPSDFVHGNYTPNDKR